MIFLPDSLPKAIISINRIGLLLAMLLFHLLSLIGIRLQVHNDQLGEIVGPTELVASIRGHVRDLS